jgi:hypothetical protein
MSHRSIVTLSAVLVAATLHAQSGKPIQPTVTQVNDRRTSGFFSRLNLVVELPNIHSADFAASRVLVQSATDDTGASLVEAKGEEPQLEQNSFALYAKADAAAKPASVSIELKNPARSAKSLKEVRGEIELYMPSRDPNSSAVIPKFLSQSGKTLTDRALKANGVEIAIISKAQLEAEKKKAGEKKRAEAKAEGLEGENLETAVTNFLENYFTPDEGDVILKVRDPQKRIESVTYLAGGEEKQAITRDKEDIGMTVLSTYAGNPQPDWSLRINMKTPKNLVRYPFVLASIPLP